MHSEASNHYAKLGLDRRCSLSQIHAAYRVLIKQHHPDLNPGSAGSLRQAQELNLAYEILSDPARRSAYDEECNDAGKRQTQSRKFKSSSQITQELSLRVEDFFGGAMREITVLDPANSSGEREIYQLVIDPGSSPGMRIRVPRSELFGGGFLSIRLKVLNGFRFKARGCDLRCDLKIKPQRVEQGGFEMIPGPRGNRVRVPIPKGVGRNEIIRVPGEGLPKPRGGRGDLLVKVTYKIEVRFSRPGK